MILLGTPNKNYLASFIIFLNVMVLTLQNSICVREVTHVDENTNPGGRGALFVSPMQSMSTESREFLLPFQSV